jgi:hypothetical protein
MLSEVEKLMRTGRSAEAKICLDEISLRSIHRSDKAHYANLARRLGLPQHALKILNPVVRGENVDGPTEDEKIEYAASLRLLGAVPEAQKILSSIDLVKFPQVYLQIAFCNISEWDYLSAIPQLKNYIESRKTFDYESITGSINLLEAYINTRRFIEARNLFETLIQMLKSTDFHLHRLRCLVLGAQLEVFETGDFAQALTRLDEAEKQVKHAPESVHKLLIEKWRAIARSLQANQVLPQINEIKKIAAHRSQWEIVRDCEFFTAKINMDEQGLRRLFFGTPFSDYRARILEALPSSFEMPKELFWGAERHLSTDFFDLARACSGDRQINLKAGQSLHRFLILLCRDFYRPTPLLTFFSHLYPDEYFDPQTSLNRVHQISTRFRKWTATHALPLRSDDTDGGYRLVFDSAYSILLPRALLPLKSQELELVQLRKNLGEAVFSIQEAMLAIGASKSTAYLLLKWGIESGKVMLTDSRKSLYRLVAPGRE